MLDHRSQCCQIETVEAKLMLDHCVGVDQTQDLEYGSNGEFLAMILKIDDAPKIS